MAGLLAAATMLTACQSQTPETTVERHFIAPPLIAQDASGMENDGVNEGQPEIGVPGRFGTAYSFREPGSWIRVAPAPELNPGANSFLISAWVKIPSPPAAGETMDLIRKGLHDTPGGELKLEIVAGGRVKCTVKDAQQRGASKFGPLTNVADGTWHRVACARTPRRLNAFLDERRASKLARTGAISNTLPLAIGSKYGQEDSPGGLLDEVTYHIAPPVTAADGSLLPLERQLEELRKPESAVGLWHLDEKDPEATR